MMGWNFLLIQDLKQEAKKPSPTWNRMAAPLADLVSSREKQGYCFSQNFTIFMSLTKLRNG